MAREYGIDGFCYYHYWFGGKKLLETPLQNLIKHQEIDMPFCICWANENWTRRWDGRDKEILIAQNHSDEDDSAFINDLIPILKDKRYIKVDGKPVVLIYRPQLLPDAKRTMQTWRNEAKKNGINDLHIIRVENFDKGKPPVDFGADAAVKFAPNFDVCLKKKISDSPVVCLYDDLIDEDVLDVNQIYPKYKSVCPSWDNAARRQDRGGVTFINDNPMKFRYWLSEVVDYTRYYFKGEEQLVFINAWNEWGEGAHLEPDNKHGYQWLEVVKNVICESKIKSDDYINQKYNLQKTIFSEMTDLRSNKILIENKLIEAEKNLARLATIQNDLDYIRNSLRWKIPNYFYKLYKNKIKKYVPRFIFRLKDIFLFVFYKIIFNLRKIGEIKFKKIIFNRSPLITIGIASYNHSKYLKKCIDSALNQTYQKIEVLIIDDNSSDLENKKILKEYEGNPKVKIIYNKENLGISASLNSQVINSSGEWVAFMDCDDYLPKDAIMEMVKYMRKNPHLRLIYSNRVEIDEKGKFLRKVWFGARALNKNIFEELLKGMVSSHLKIIHKDAFKKIGLFDPRFGGTHDYDFFLRMAFYLPKRFGFIDKYLYYHRIHANQNTIVDGNKHKKNVDKILEEAKLRKLIYDGDFGKKVSIIILSFNRCEQLKNTVKNILKRVDNIKYDILIWDNGSTNEKLIGYLREIDGKNNIKVVFSKENLKAAGGRKEANKLVDGDYIIYFDNDIEVKDNLFEEMIIRLEESDDIASCCARIIFPDHRVQYTGGLIFKEGEFINFILDGNGVNEDNLSTMIKRDYDWLGTGATMTKRKYFNLADFDLNFINAYEDNDYYMQIRKNNLRLVHSPTASVIHHHVNYEIRRDEGTNKYVEVRHNKDSFLKSWMHFYKKWGLIIRDDFIFGIAGLKDKSDSEIKEYLDKNNL